MARNTITLTPPTRHLEAAQNTVNTLLRQQENYQRNVEHYENTVIPEREAELQGHRERVIALEQLLASSLADTPLFTAAIESDKLKENYLQVQENAANRLEQYRQQLERYRDAATRAQRGLADERQLLARLRAEHSGRETALDRRVLRAALTALPGVERATFRDTDELFSINLRLKDLTMSYMAEQKEVALFAAGQINQHFSENPSPHGIDFHPIDPASIPLPEFSVTLKYDKRRGTCSLSSRTIDRSFVSPSSYPGAHPHWISRNNPCLGDFSGPIYEAMGAFDFISAAEVIHSYLTQYNLDDSAGRTALFWANGHLRHFNPFRYDNYHSWHSRMEQAQSESQPEDPPIIHGHTADRVIHDDQIDAAGLGQTHNRIFRRAWANTTGERLTDWVGWTEDTEPTPNPERGTDT